MQHHHHHLLLLFLLYLRPVVLPIVLSVLPSTLAADTRAVRKPCTIHSPSTGSYHDLRPLDLSLQQNSKSGSDNNNNNNARTESWHARGYDYPSNFSLNICGPVIESLRDVDGIPESRWANVSAFYRGNDGDGDAKTYSIGQSNSELIFRGRRLLLNYTGGSPCPELAEDGSPKARDMSRRKIIDHDDADDSDDDDDDDRKNRPQKARSTPRRKSTLLSLHCDRDPGLSTHPSLSFLGSPDHCVYVFEARSRYFCGGATSGSEPGSIGPGGVFGVIIVIAVLAYLVGGCAYQRIVMRQRGWRQCPHHAVWMGLAGFVKDMFTTLFSCTRYLPSFSSAFNSRGGRGGYVRVGVESGARRRGATNGSAVNAGVIGRGRSSSDDENRLIDQLDEEWDD